MWHSIQYVTSPFALVAFVVASAAYVLRSRVQRDLNFLRELPPDSRERGLNSILGSYSISDRDLTSDQRFELAKTVIEQRLSRLKVIARYAIIAFAILAAVIVAVSLAPSANTAKAKPQPQIIPLKQ